MEKRDLYDGERRFTGRTIYKGEDIPKGMHILVVIIVMQNIEGKFLIQKRSINKDGKWALTGGHPKAGESSLEGIKTEVKEELGIDIPNPTLFYTTKDEDSFCDLYYLKKDVSLKDLVLQEDEVSDAIYATKEEIDNLFNKGIFKKSHYLVFQEYLKYAKEDKKCHVMKLK